MSPEEMEICVMMAPSAKIEVGQCAPAAIKATNTNSHSRKAPKHAPAPREAHCHGLKARDRSCACGVACAKAVRRAAKPGGAASGFAASHASMSSFMVCLQNLSQSLPRAMQPHLGRTDRTALDICNRRQIEIVDVARRKQPAIGSAQAIQRGLKPALPLP